MVCINLLLLFSIVFDDPVQSHWNEDPGAKETHALSGEKEMVARKGGYFLISARKTGDGISFVTPSVRDIFSALRRAILGAPWMTLVRQAPRCLGH